MFIYAEETAPKRISFSARSCEELLMLTGSRQTRPGMHCLHMGPQVVSVLLGGHESVRLQVNAQIPYLRTNFEAR